MQFACLYDGAVGLTQGRVQGTGHIQVIGLILPGLLGLEQEPDRGQINPAAALVSPQLGKAGVSG